MNERGKPPSLLEDAHNLLLQLVRQPDGRPALRGRLLRGNVLVAGAAAARVVVGVGVLAGPDSRLGDQVLVQPRDRLDARVADVGRACGEENGMVSLVEVSKRAILLSRRGPWRAWRMWGGDCNCRGDVAITVSRDELGSRARFETTVSFVSARTDGKSFGGVFGKCTHLRDQC